MARMVTRRTALKVIGGVTAAAAGAFAGLLPEASLRAAAAGGGFADAARGRQFVLRQRIGEGTRNARAATALARPSGAIARRFLATRGFPGKIQSVESADVLWSDGELIGTIDNVVFYDRAPIATAISFGRSVRTARSLASLFGVARTRSRVRCTTFEAAPSP
jgi:hypothetical protein